MGVSKNSGTILIGFSIINHPFWGTPICGNIYVFYLERSVFSRHQIYHFKGIFRWTAPVKRSLQISWEHFMIELGFAKLNGSFLEDGDGSLIAKGGLPKCWNFQVAHRQKRRVAADCSSAYDLIIIGLFLSVAVCFGLISAYCRGGWNWWNLQGLAIPCRRSVSDFSRRRWIKILTKCSLKAKIPA